MQHHYSIFLLIDEFYLNRNVIFKNYNMVARVVAGFHQLSYFQLHCGGASGGDGLHEHNLVV